MNFSKLLHQAKAFLLYLSRKEMGLVVLFVVLFAASALFLSFTVERNLDPDAGKNWWALAFDSPKSESLSFFIENHGSGTGFSYAVLQDKATLDTGTIDIAKGARKDIFVPAEAGTGRITVTVTDASGKKKEIYRQ
jgi:hypothetical protein